MTEQHDIVVIGAGIVGLMSARALLKCGHRPIVLDRQPKPRESSWSAAGLLAHIPPWRESLIEPLSTQMLRHSQREYQVLGQELVDLGIEVDLGLDLSGFYLDASGCHRQLNAWLDQTGEPVESERDNFPEFLRTHLAQQRAWVRLPQYGGQIRPPHLLEALRQYLRSHKVGLYCETVKSVNASLKGFAVRTSEGSRTHLRQATTVLVCAGSWSNAIYPNTQAPTITPVGGHILRYHLNDALAQRFVLGDDSGRYIVSRGDGTILVGSNRQHRQFDTTPDADVINTLKDFAASLLPVLGSQEIQEVWVGLRPACTQSEWPVLYRYRDTTTATTATTGTAGCYLHSGHYHSGIAFAPATATALANSINSGDEAIDVEGLEGLSQQCRL